MKYRPTTITSPTTHPRPIWKGPDYVKELRALLEQLLGIKYPKVEEQPEDCDGMQELVPMRIPLKA
jgi:hypothetical protein